jgi:hypothetical protein
MAASAACGRTAPRLLHEGDLMADYFQIYVRDQNHPDLPADYRTEAIDGRLTMGPHAAILYTARNMPVPVTVEWHDVKPPPALERYQHVVEGSFTCPSGTLILAGLTDYDPTATRMAVDPGPLGIRANISGLDTISEDGLHGCDSYLLQLWPGIESAGPRILKAWEGP